MAQTKIDTKQIKENIARSKQLRNQQYKYNGGATLTTLSAIALYFGSAITLENKEQSAGIAMLAIAAINNLAAIYCIGKSYQKGKQAMQALMHNINTKAK